MKLFIYLAAILTLLLYSGCKDESISSIDPVFEIQRLSTGSSFYYIDSTRSGDVWYVDSTRITIPEKGTVTGEVNSQGVYFWDEYVSGEFIKRKMLNLEQDGLYQYAEVNGTDTLHLRKMIAKYPADPGDTFTEPRYIYNQESNSYDFAGNWVWHCISIDYPVIIDNDVNLLCHVYRAQPEQGTEVLLFYALNVGYTGTQIISNSTLQYKQILTRFDIK